LVRFKYQLFSLINDLFTTMLMSSFLMIGLGCAVAITNLDQQSGRRMVGSEVQELHGEDHFSRPLESIAYLFAVFTSNYVLDVNEFTAEMKIFFLLSIFSVIFLLNLMSAMFAATIHCSSGKVEGLTYLERGNDITALEAMCTLEKRTDIWKSLHFDQQIEFDEGDLGLKGAIQVQESITKHSKDASDRVRRFPGAAGTHLPWPADKKDATSTEAKMSRVNDAYTKIYQMVRDMTKKKGGLRGEVGGSQSQSQGQSSSANPKEGSSDDQPIGAGRK